MDFLERLSDAELLERTAHEARAFATFYCRHERLILRYLMRCCHEAEQTIDLAAETFARALEGAEHFDREGNGAAPWLLGIAHATFVASVRRGVVADHARRRLGCQPLVLDDDAVSRVELRASLPIQQVLETLALAQRKAVIDLVADEAEVEVRLRCSPQLLRSRARTGFGRLSQALALTDAPRPRRQGQSMPMEPVLVELETLLATSAGQHVKRESGPSKDRVQPARRRLTWRRSSRPSLS
jgi:DNA-directed RNA polymerase specialized sigma24 family protein